MFKKLMQRLKTMNNSTTFAITDMETGETALVEVFDNEVDDWVEIKAVQKWLDNKDAKLYYLTGMNESPIYARIYIEDLSCKCITVVKRHVKIETLGDNNGNT